MCATFAPGQTATGMTGSSTATRCGSATAASPASTSSTPSSTRSSATRAGTVHRARRYRWLDLVRKLDKLGCRASHTAELKFNGVRVPAENLLGGQDKLEHKLAKAREAIEGGRHSGSATMGTFEQTRPMVAAQALGIARAALEYATEYANRREAFGAPIIDNQGIAFPLADLATADRRRPTAHLACLLDGGDRSAVRTRRGVDVPS